MRRSPAQNKPSIRLKNTGSTSRTKMSLPLFPLSSPRKIHKRRPITFLLHRRSRSSGILCEATKQRNPSHQDDGDRSVLSLCSMTSEEYEGDESAAVDTVNSFDDDTSVLMEEDVPLNLPNETQMMQPSSSMLPPFSQAFPHWSKNMHAVTSTVDTACEMVTPVTPATPTTRVTLKMRPSTFSMPLSEEDDLYMSAAADINANENNKYTFQHIAWTDHCHCDDFVVSPIPYAGTDNQRNHRVHFVPDTDSTSMEEYDDIQYETNNRMPPPRTPSPYIQHYNNNHDGTNRKNRSSSPPRIPPAERNVIYMSFSTDPNDDPHDAMVDETYPTVTIHSRNWEHLLLPNDF
jgi:hypothetical protein